MSVLEHIEGDGAAAALRELARVVRPGGRVVVTLPHADQSREEWRDRPLYAEIAALTDRIVVGDVTRAAQEALPQALQ